MPGRVLKGVPKENGREEGETGARRGHESLTFVVIVPESLCFVNGKIKLADSVDCGAEGARWRGRLAVTEMFPLFAHVFTELHRSVVRIRLTAGKGEIIFTPD